MYYITHDSENRVTGLYPSGGPIDIPMGAVEVSEDTAAAMRTHDRGPEVFDYIGGGAVAPNASRIAAAEARESAAARRAEIDRELSRIDMSSVRALRAKLAGTGSPDDDLRIADAEARAAALRNERGAL